MITEIINIPETASLIPLSRGAFAIVDTNELRLLNLYRWSLSIDNGGKRYARRYEKGKTIYMHRVIIDTPQGMETDHINGNGLDNRRQNLRICNKSQNMQNQVRKIGKSSIFKGVDWHKCDRRWRARIQINKKKIHIGSFKNEVEAAKAYDKKAIEIFGKFARKNFKDIKDGTIYSDKHNDGNIYSISP